MVTRTAKHSAKTNKNKQEKELNLVEFASSSSTWSSRFTLFVGSVSLPFERTKSDVSHETAAAPPFSHLLSTRSFIRLHFIRRGVVGRDGDEEQNKTNTKSSDDDTTTKTTTKTTTTTTTITFHSLPSPFQLQLPKRTRNVFLDMIRRYSMRFAAALRRGA